VGGVGASLTQARASGRLAGMPRTKATLAEIAQRVAALEERLRRLEQGRPPPGDGRTTSAPRPGPRCAGCGLPLRRRRGRCAECGRPIEP
jgi:hypothetical protein